MANKYFDGKLVNDQWYTFLTEARKDGVNFRLNSGKRTMREQWVLYNRYRRGQGPVAAYPNPRAPHIRSNHAVDIGPTNSNTQALINYGRRHGVDLRRTVRSEFWHLESFGGLDRFHKRHKGSDDPVLRRGQKGRSIIKLKKLLYSKGMRNFSGERSSNRYNPFFSIWTERTVKRFQRAKGLKADGVVGPATWRALRK